MAGLSIWPRMAEILYNQLKWYGSNWQADIFHANIYKSVESHYNKYGHTCTNYEDILVFPNGYCPVPMSSRSQKWMENSNGCRWLEFQPGTRKMFIDVHEAPENSAIMSGNNPFLFVIIADYRILRSNQLHFWLLFNKHLSILWWMLQLWPEIPVSSQKVTQFMVSKSHL
jgi:hypothetical protein